MITEKELKSAIAECESEPITLSKIGKLANFYIIYDHLFGEPEKVTKSQQSMALSSFSPAPPERVEEVVRTNGDSEFLKAIDGRKAERVWKLMDELVEAVKILHPRMYTSFIDKVQDL